MGVKVTGSGKGDREKNGRHGGWMGIISACMFCQSQSGVLSSCKLTQSIFVGLEIILLVEQVEY